MTYPDSGSRPYPSPGSGIKASGGRRRWARPHRTTPGSCALPRTGTSIHGQGEGQGRAGDPLRPKRVSSTAAASPAMTVSTCRPQADWRRATTDGDHDKSAFPDHSGQPEPALGRRSGLHRPLRHRLPGRDHAGLRPFEAEPTTLTRHVSAKRESLTLLPQAVRTGTTGVKDDF